jgi:hypothetical protein
MANATSEAEIRGYDSGVFQRLSEFHSARDDLDANRALLSELGDVICLHGFHDRFGVSLLHKHFEISEDELLVREFVENVSYIKPWQADARSSPLPYLWKAEIDGKRAVYYPLEFCDYSEPLKTQARRDLELLQGARAFLTAFAKRLAELGLCEVFGLVSLRSREA